MSAGDRFKSWLESLSESWKDRLRGWLAGVLGIGIEAFVDILGRSASTKLAPFLARLEDTGEIPPELLPFFAELKNPTGEAAGVALGGMARSVAGSLTTSMLEALLRPMRYLINRSSLNELVGPDLALSAWMRGYIDEGALKHNLSSHGFNDWAQDKMKKSLQVILPTDVFGPAYMRDPVRWGYLWEEAKKLGLNSDQLELLRDMLWRVPGIQDVIRYAVKEVYKPEIYQEFGQDQEFPTEALGDAAKTGIREDHLRKEWIAHWELPGVSQGFEMLHRSIITADQLDKLLKARDVMPFWRKGLTDISWNLPGRIELRMMARYGLVDKTFLMEALKKDGLSEEYRETVADMNLVLGMYTDLANRYTKGWLTREGLATELVASGMSEDIRTRLYQYIVKSESANRTITQKNLSVAQIEKGVKKDKITRAQAVDLITDLGYDMAEAVFILAVDVPEDETDAAVKARELTKSDILAGLEAGTITAEESLAKLTAIRYTPADAKYILDVYQASVKKPADPAKKDITKADVITAVKQGLITPEQGYILLIKLNYTSEAADFILALVPETSPFSPANYEEFKALTRAWGAAQSLTGGELPAGAQELKLLQAQAVAEGKNPMLEQLRIQIDTIRRQRRGNLITRDQEVEALRKLSVPEDYLKALVDNDDTRITLKKG